MALFALLVTWVVERREGVGEETDHFARPGLMLDFTMAADGALVPARAMAPITRYSDPELGRAPALSEVQVRAMAAGSAARWASVAVMPVTSSEYGALVPPAVRGADGVRIVVTHGHEIGSVNPPRLVSAYMNADVIVYGHTHVQLVTKAARRIVVNPGAAGPRRFKLQPSVAKLYILNGKADVELIPLGIPEDVVILDDEE